MMEAVDLVVLVAGSATEAAAERALETDMPRLKLGRLVSVDSL